MNYQKDIIDKNAILLLAIEISKEAKVGLIKILQSIDNESNTHFSLLSGGHIGGRNIKGFDELENFFEILKSKVFSIPLNSFDVDLHELFGSTINGVILYAELYLCQQLNSVSILDELSTKIQAVDFLIAKLQKLSNEQLG